MQRTGNLSVVLTQEGPWEGKSEGTQSALDWLNPKGALWTECIQWTEDGSDESRKAPWGGCNFLTPKNKVLAPHCSSQAAYVNNVFIVAAEWEKHPKALKAVLQKLRRARLMANPKNCATRKEEAQYLRFSVG